MVNFTAASRRNALIPFGTFNPQDNINFVYPEPGDSSVVIPVEAYGAAGDGITDDTTAIQNAINALAGTSAVLWMAKRYKITREVVSAVGGMTIDGGGTIYNATAGNYGIKFYGTYGTVNTNVTIDVNGNFSGRFTSSAMSVTVASTTGISAGTWLLLSYNASSTRLFYQVAQVQSVVGSVVSFYTPIFIPMDHTQSNTIQNFTPVTDLHIRNLTLDGSKQAAGSTSAILSLWQCCDCSVENLKVQNVVTGGTNADTTLFYSNVGYGNYFNNILSYDGKAYNGDMWFAAQTHGQIDHIRSHGYNNTNAAGPSISNCVDCSIGEWTVVGSTFRGTRVLGCAHLRFSQVNLHDHPDNGMFITWNSYHIYCDTVFASNCANADAFAFGGDNEGYIGVNHFYGFTNPNGWNDQTTTGTSYVGKYFAGNNSTANIPIVQQGNVYGFQDSVAIGTSSAGAITLNSQYCVIQTESLTTAAGSAYNLALTNNRCSGIGQFSVSTNTPVFVNVANGTNTQGTPIVGRVTMSAGAANIQILNIHSSQAFNGTLIIHAYVMCAA